MGNAAPILATGAGDVTSSGNINLTLKDTVETAGIKIPHGASQVVPENENRIIVERKHSQTEVADDETTNRSLGGAGDPAAQIEFSTDKHNSFMKQESQSPRRKENTIKGKKSQGFLPREFLQFLMLDGDFIDNFIETQQMLNPDFEITGFGNSSPKKGLADQNQNEFYCIETQREEICDEVKKLLINVCSQEEFFHVKIEVASAGGNDSRLILAFKVNNEHTFHKSVSDLTQFCNELNEWADGKNSTIEQLNSVVQECF